MLFTCGQRVFTSFFLFGLLNNILYVVILSAAIDLVGASAPKGIVLLADITPALFVKALAPFFIHLVPYSRRIWALVFLSSSGMLLISLSPDTSSHLKVTGIAVASLSSGLGELTFLQLTHYYPRNFAIGGFSSGTGGAGLVGSFVFMLMTNVLSVPVWLVLLGFALVPCAFLVTYYGLLPNPDTAYSALDDSPAVALADCDSVLTSHTDPPLLLAPQWLWKRARSAFASTVLRIKPLFAKYMLPLGTVYLSEYIINQGISPTVLFPLDTLPHWLFSSYRDIYVVYGFLYQLGVFVLRTSNLFGVRIYNLHLLAVLQFFNLVVFLLQSAYDMPFPSIYLVLAAVFYEGLLGGLSYVNTFLSVSENVAPEVREFSMGCVSMSDSFGVVLAGCVNWWLEPRLCAAQVARGRDWCRAAPHS